MFHVYTHTHIYKKETNISEMKKFAHDSPSMDPHQQ